MAAYDVAAAAVADGFAAKAARASGAATEVLTASAGLTRDKGLRQAVASRVEGGAPLLGAVHEGIAQFVDVFTAMGGLMAERATDLLDIERRLVARLVGEPEPGRRPPRRRLGPRCRRPGPGRHRGSRPGAGARAGHREGRRDQPHRDHRPTARHPVCGGRGRRPGARGRRQRAGRCDRRNHRPRRRRGRRPGPGRGRPGRPGRPGLVDRPRRDDRRRPREAAGQRRRRRLGTLAAAAPGGGRGPVPHRAVLPRPARGADRRRAGRDLRRGARRVRRRRTATSSYAPSMPAPTSRSRSRRSRTRRTRPSASVGCGSRSTTRGSWIASWTGSPRRPGRRAPRPG